ARHALSLQRPGRAGAALAAASAAGRAGSHAGEPADGAAGAGGTPGVGGPLRQSDHPGELRWLIPPAARREHFRSGNFRAGAAARFRAASIALVMPAAARISRLLA